MKDLCPSCGRPVAPAKVTAIAWPVVNLGSFAVAVVVFHMLSISGIDNEVLRYGVSGVVFLIAGISASIYFNKKFRADDGGSYCVCCDTESNP
jgi:hypothetical protein